MNRSKRMRFLSVVVRSRLDLAAEHAVAYRCIAEHEGKDEKAFSPEHERETRMRCRGLVDGDRERNHVGPERSRERTECRSENERAHVERRAVATASDACSEDDRRRGGDQRK